MESYNLYQDIATRTNGDIYIGVVGPVRSGKSTFIKKFMDGLVLPNITDNARRARVIDEMPQSADGRSVMTTEPKFVPDGGVKVMLADDIEVNVRLIDCVGYMIDNMEMPSRNVKTPWSAQDLPFNEAAEIGTKKVMCEHTTIGMVITTDGSITDYNRSDYVVAEERIVAEMKSSCKPFIIVLNSRKPESSECKKLATELEMKYNVSVFICDISNMDIMAINMLLESILNEFPIKHINCKMPKWMQMLPMESDLIKCIIAELNEVAERLNKMKDYVLLKDCFSESDNMKKLTKIKLIYSNGSLVVELEPKEHLFYKILSEVCNVDINDETGLFKYIKDSNSAIMVYDKMKTALESVEEFGYGVVTPTEGEIEFSEPIIEDGVKSNINMEAKATCLHIIKVDVKTSVSPVIGTGNQAQEMVNYLKNEFSEDLNCMWKTNLLGKSMRQIASDTLNSKMYSMPVDAQMKLKKTVGRIVNEGRGGVLCVLL